MAHYERVNLDDCGNLRSYESLAVKDTSIPKYLISIYSISRLQWDCLVTVFALFNAFLVTFYLSFDCNGMMSPPMLTCGLFTDLIFILDIYLSIITTAIDKNTGDEIISRRRLFSLYLFNSFILDIVSAAPIFFIGKPCSIISLIVTLVRLTKLYRIFVVVSRLMYFRLRKNVRLIIKLIELVLWLMIYIHLMACLWFYIIGINNEWQPFLLYFDNRDFHSLPVNEKYSWCIYTIISSISRIEMLPTNEIEYIFLGVSVIIGMLIVGIIYGSIIVLLQDLGKESVKFATEHEKIVNTIKNLHLPMHLQLKITEFFTSSFAILDQEISYQKLMTFLPPSIKKKLNAFLFQQLFKSSKIFHGQQKLVNYAIQQLDNKFSQPEEEIIKQFEEGDKIYFVSEGECEVEVLDELKEKHIVKLLNPGDCFGEIAVILKAPRTATVRSVGFTTLAVLGAAKLSNLFHKFPNVKKVMLSEVSHYKDPYRIFLEKILSKLKYLNGLDIMAFNKLIYMLPVVSCHVGTDLFSLGDTCNSCFMILDGTVQILFEVHGQSIFKKLQDKASHVKDKTTQEVKKLKAVNLVIDELGIGSVIGLNLLLLQQKFVVSCRCSKQARVMIFNKDHLNELILKFPYVKKSVEEIIANYTIWDSVLESDRQIRVPLDYYKCHRYDNGPFKKSSKVRIKFKNAVINKILTIRENNIKNLPKITNVMERLRAVALAEEMERKDIAVKISKGELQPEAVQLHELLQKKSIKNPLITQFAQKSKETSEVSVLFKQHLRELILKFADLKKAGDAAESTARGLKALSEELAKI